MLIFFGNNFLLEVKIEKSKDFICTSLEFIFCSVGLSPITHNKNRRRLFEDINERDGDLDRVNKRLKDSSKRFFSVLFGLSDTNPKDIIDDKNCSLSRVTSLSFVDKLLL